VAARKRSAAPRGPQGPRSTGWIVSRVVFAMLAIGVLAFAVQGGEYGTTDLIRQKKALVVEQAAVDSLEGRVAELAAYKEAVENDRVTQERIAREEFGMVRPGEVLYRFADPR
jgi:cell division protein FtsB